MLRTMSLLYCLTSKKWDSNMRETKFKKTDIGLIPEEWEITTLGEISQKPSYGVGAEAIPFNGYDKYIRITDIDDSNGAYVPNPIVSPSFYSDQHIVRENDLLVARTGASVGKSYLYNKKDGKLIFAGFLMKLNICAANSQLVFYNTKTNRYQSWVASESARTGQPGLNIEQLKSFQLAVPSNDNEQRRIAKALRDIDGLISSLTKLIEKKQNIKTATMQQLLTGKKRLEGFTEPWVTIKLSETGYMTAGGTPSTLIADYWGGEINWVQSGVIHDCIVKESQVEKRITLKGLQNSATHLIKKDSVLVAITGATCGNVAYLPFESTANQSVISIETNSQYNSYFLYNLLKIYRNMILELRSGSAQGGVNLASLRQMEVLVPPTFDEQTAIANILTSMDNEISALEAKKAKYESIKKGMMQELLTGRIRLV